MITLSKSSLINTKIAQFYSFTIYEEPRNVSAFFEANAAFNTEKIVQYIWPNLRSDEVFKDLENYKFEDYLQCCNKLLPIFQYTSEIFKDINENFDNALNLKWMGDNVNVYLNMKNNYNNNKTATFEHLLILTALLANGLTNIYLSQVKGKHAPHLLKDLINSFEIINVLGIEMVIILKILMGSPNSINLRNIVWHGFPKPMEIPSYYVPALLITIHTLGCAIEARKIQTKNRALITNFKEHIKFMEENCQLKSINLAYIEEELEMNNSDFKIYWQRVLTYYKSEKYLEFIMLVLPQIELLLRLHYGAVNNCDVAAKLDEYYITIDTIFKPKVFNGSKAEESLNKLLDFENSTLEGSFHLLYDIFISPNGCRLRDKVSHGEVYLHALNNSQLCKIVFQIFIDLLFPAEFGLFKNYESNLHLNASTKTNLMRCFNKLETFHRNCVNTNREFTFQPFVIEQDRILIFKRPKKEPELILLINKIAANIIKTIANYEESIEFRCTLLVQRELHSKRRRTLENLQTALPEIFKTLLAVISSCMNIFTILQTDWSYILEKEQNYDQTLRFLKHSLTISENFIKYSHYENNEWIKSLQLCQKHNEFRKNFSLCDEFKIKIISNQT